MVLGIRGWVPAQYTLSSKNNFVANGPYVSVKAILYDHERNTQEKSVT